MATVAELRERLDALATKIEEAQKSGDVDAELRAIEEEDAVRAELAEEQKRARKLIGKRIEREERVKAAGAYLVGFVDMADKLRGADVSKIPGGGVVVLRSHTAASKKTWDSEAEAKSRPMADIMTDLVCANVLRLGGVDLAKPGVAEGFRAFLESDLGSGLANQLGAEVLRLGGANAEEAKRATR